MSHRELIQALKLYPAILKDFVNAIPLDKLHHRLGPGFWTVYEHLEHLVLTQQVIQQRLETIRDHEKPQIVPFNPDEHHREVSVQPRQRGKSGGGLWALERTPAGGDREGLGTAVAPQRAAS